MKTSELTYRECVVQNMCQAYDIQFDNSDESMTFLSTHPSVPAELQHAAKGVVQERK